MEKRDKWGERTILKNGQIMKDSKMRGKIKQERCRDGNTGRVRWVRFMTIGMLIKMSSNDWNPCQ